MAQKMTDTQLLHKATGIRRIKQAVKNCDLPVSEIGTIFKIMGRCPSERPL